MGLVQFIAARLRRSHNRIYSSSYLDGLHPHDLGKLGERVACSWAKAQGVKILRRNFNPGNGGEIDLVYRDGGELVFCEVKSRTRTDYGSPARAVDEKKKRLIKRGARVWKKWLNGAYTSRYDIIEVVFLPDAVPQVHLIKNAFA